MVCPPPPLLNWLKMVLKHIVFRIPDINLSDMLLLILYILSLCLIIFLTMMASVLLVNFLLRPKLWTAILIYFLLTKNLGSFNIFIITSIISQNLDTLQVETDNDISQLVAIQIDRWTQLEEECSIHVLYSGTWLFREGILTGKNIKLSSN